MIEDPQAGREMPADINVNERFPPEHGAYGHEKEAAESLLPSQGFTGVAQEHASHAERSDTKLQNIGS